MDALILPEILDTRYAVPFSELLKKQEGAFLLDGESVQRVGGLCFQLLVSAFATAQTLGTSFEIRNVSDEMKENLTLLGGDFLLKGEGAA
ncbi:anti-sigma factor antagonist [Gluconobacter sp. Dm-73]|uniref:STAS domain-containing protein n=1 Tax=Gluconobacter sp. Dm-73 TaxID=2799802 RepID=UPI001B8DA53F|nr:STAS domain-containing protein [Gluconobacter sp. Dm-73]MBS1073304.1 anti-sigma factor antagonist [Gluconobacter sp. Dm-73]